MIPSRSPVSVRLRIEGGFARCDSREARVNRILWPHAAVLQLRDVPRGQVEVNVRVGFGCLGLLTRRRRIGFVKSGPGFQRPNDFVRGRRGKVFVARIAFVRTVNLGVGGRSPPTYRIAVASLYSCLRSSKR